MDRRVKGVSISRGAPTISNLMFVDDSILFCQATTGEVEVINEVLQTYANALGQCINMEKSSAYFSSNTCRLFTICRLFTFLFNVFHFE